jgi:hypothetical protein
MLLLGPLLMVLHDTLSMQCCLSAVDGNSCRLCESQDQLPAQEHKHSYVQRTIAYLAASTFSLTFFFGAISAVLLPPAAAAVVTPRHQIQSQRPQASK